LQHIEAHATEETLPKLRHNKNPETVINVGGCLCKNSKFRLITPISVTEMDSLGLGAEGNGLKAR
jgi:hypothetical protein